MKQRPQVSPPPPPRRDGGRSLLPIVALISLALLALTVMPAIAQMPPSHVHSWAAAKPNDPPASWQPDLQASVGMIRFNYNATTQSNVPYVRCGDTVTCQDIGLVVDKDYCTCTIGTCSRNYEASESQGTVVNWTDGDVGGEFGKFDAQSQWVPMGANCDDPFGTGELTARLRRGATIYSKVESANIPYDYNGANFAAGQKGGNKVWDGWSGDTGPGTGYNATDDTDVAENGADVDGDGLSRYEEWRGFKISGEYARTDPELKELFVYRHTDGYSGLGAFPGDLDITIHYVTLDEQNSLGVINRYYATAHLDSRHAVETKYYTLALGTLGSTNQPVSIGAAVCKVDKEQCEDQADENNKTLEEYRNAVLTHELGHSVMCVLDDPNSEPPDSLDHHHTPTSTCVMTLALDGSWSTLPTTFCTGHQNFWFLVWPE